MRKRVLAILFVLLMSFSLSFTAFAAQDIQRLYDDANLLTEAEESDLIHRLDRVSETYKVDIIIVTVDTVGNYTSDEYIELIYDQNNFGYGENRDGVMLLIAMQERDYRILSNGLGADAISMDDIESIGDYIAPELSGGYYADAFRLFIDECEYEINGEINGFPFEFGINLGISLVIGLIVALIVTGIMRMQLKSVGMQLAATEYVKSGSMHLTTSNDLFLYRTISRIKRETDSSRSSRSSGGSRNVGGGKF